MKRHHHLKLVWTNNEYSSSFNFFESLFKFNFQIFNNWIEFVNSLYCFEKPTSLLERKKLLMKIKDGVFIKKIFNEDGEIFIIMNRFGIEIASIPINFSIALHNVATLEE